MDSKEKQLFYYYYEKFRNSTFEEYDVYAFLILIRRHCPDNRSISELADFIAHRDKSRGYIKEYLEELKDKFNKIYNNSVEKQMKIKVEEVFTFKEIKNGLNSVFKKFNLEELNIDIINDFLLCLLSILQDIKIYHKKKEIGKLSLGITSKKVVLVGSVKISREQKEVIDVVFPVLSCKNNYKRIKKLDKFDSPYTFPKIICVKRINGKLEIE
ncbi:hypothetical protein C1N92_19745 [Bacillus velezensis]|uniref:hypothetical protein n=1 Tax=Bacillus velezensis TaxID=492670 RepID=UPI000D738BB6|nr:hypothetical protein [Bacillus velezensis]AWQ16945.1 hypothetical protein C1N92_19745 [Bacillus velezensis]